MELPDGLVARPLTADDASAVYTVMVAAELHDVGEVVIEEADIVADWQRPSFDVSASTIGVFDGPRLVAYAELTSPTRGDAAVDPAYRRRGLGTALAHWMQGLARRNGSTDVGSPVPQGSDGDTLLASLGYRVRWETWILSLPEGREIEPQPIPAGYAVRTATPEEYAAVLGVVEDAFGEWADRERETLEDFLATTVHRPGHEPWMLRVLTDPSGEIVGSCCSLLTPGSEPGGATSYVEKVAVRKDHRNRGLARALLVDAFTLGRAHGATRSELCTDSRTGALSLYLKVGMEITSTWVNRGIAL